MERVSKTLKQENRRKFAPALLLSAVIIWGISYVFTKSVLTSVSPIVLTCVSYIYAGIAGIPFVIAKRKLISKKILFYSVVLGATLFFSRLVQVFGCNLTTAGKNAFITSSYVVMVPILGAVLLKSRVSIKNIVLAFISLLGIALIALNENMTGVNLGDILTLIGAVGFALHIIYNGVYVQEHDAILIGVLQIEVTAVISIIVMLIQQESITSWCFDPKVQLPFLYLGVISTLFGFLLQSIGQEYVVADKASMILAMESVSGAIFSALLLHERYRIRLLIGCLIVFLANMIANIELAPPEKFVKFRKK